MTILISYEECVPLGVKLKSVLPCSLDKNKANETESSMALAVAPPAQSVGGAVTQNLVPSKVVPLVHPWMHVGMVAGYMCPKCICLFLYKITSYECTSITTVRHSSLFEDTLVKFLQLYIPEQLIHLRR